MAIPIETTESNVDENMSPQVSADLCIDYLKMITSDNHFILDKACEINYFLNGELKEEVDNHTMMIEDLKTKVNAMDAKLDKIIDMLLKR